MDEIKANDLIGVFQVFAQRAGRRKPILIRGNVSQWLRNQNAQPTVKPMVFSSGGWQLTVQRMSPETLASMYRIFGDSKYAPYPDST